MTSQAATNGRKYDSSRNDIEIGREVDDRDNFNFTDESIRKGFQQKVYALLTIQLLTVTTVIGLFLFVDKIKYFILKYPEFYGISLVIGLILIILLACCESIRRKHPINLIFLGIFTICDSIILAIISITYDTQIVLMTIGITGLICIALMIYAKQTKFDFTVCGGVLLASLLIFIVFGIIIIFIPSIWLQCIYSGIGVIIFSLYLIMDVQLITTGKHRYSIHPDEYILAVLTLYLDITNIYVYLLWFFNVCKN